MRNDLHIRGWLFRRFDVAMTTGEVTMARRCALTGKKPRVGNKVSHANNKTKTVQLPNLQTKRLWSEAQKQFVRVRLSARALRTVTRKGLDRFLQENGLTVSDVR